MGAINRAIVGLGTGSFVYLLTVFVAGGGYLDRADIAGAFAISVFVGLATLVFSIQRLSYLSCLVLHYLATIGFIFGMCQVVDPVTNIETFIMSATALYVVSYLVVCIQKLLTTRRLNHLIAQVRASVHDKDTAADL